MGRSIKCRYDYASRTHKLYSHEYNDFYGIHSGDTFVLEFIGYYCKAIVTTVLNECSLEFVPLVNDKLTELLHGCPTGLGMTLQVIGSSFKKDGYTFHKTDWKMLEDEDLLIEEIEI